ncbi:hypothetical protein JHQ77_05645 [Neisseria meningitidis]|nr:hypothetical protein [Neisseria meningitidis]MCG3362158.1 hypothetical protein [Neisseria meningitidis]
MPSETFFQTAFLIPLPDCAADSNRGTPYSHIRTVQTSHLRDGIKAAV